MSITSLALNDDNKDTLGALFMWIFLVLFVRGVFDLTHQ